MHCEISGSQYFTKLDMNSAYHQITLAPESRNITTFTTHCGTFRYKTLFFGCSSASEDFANELGKKLAGLEGVIPNFSTIIAPISSMLSKTAVYIWGEEQEEAFQTVLEEIRSPRILQHFDPLKETSIIVDASPVGLCAILVQEEKPVLFTSRKLTQVEQRYSQTEREALSVVWACERLHFYVYGIDFEVVTDHKALEILYSPKGKPAARILRWYIRLLPYSFVVKYSPGRDNPADYFSRKPVSGSSEGETLATETED